MTGQTPTCPRCQIGVLRPAPATYAGVYRGVFLSVPAVPAYTCDICHHREFDPQALSYLDALVGQLSQPQEPARPAAKPAPPEGDPAERGRQTPLKP